MHVDPSESPAHQPVPFHQGQHFFVLRHRHLRQRRQEREDLLPCSEVPARQLAEDEGVAGDLSGIEASAQPRVAPPEVIDPNGGVDEHYRPAARRRGTGRSPLSEAPRAARRRALSRAMSAARPAWTTAVFSFRPLRRRASLRSWSSRLIVVRIWPSMHDQCIGGQASARSRHHGSRRRRSGLLRRFRTSSPALPTVSRRHSTGPCNGSASLLRLKCKEDSHEYG
jgi:hypothetical protein